MIWTAVLRLALAAALLAAAVAKLINPASGRRALSSYGIRQAAAQRITWAALIALELTIAAGLAAGWTPAAWAGLALTAAGAAVTASLLGRGHAGRPCPCFGGRSRIGSSALATDLVLAGGMVLVLAVPTYQPSRDEWLAIGLVVALLTCAALILAVAALAREVGMLRMRVGPSAALEIPAEGPALGLRSALAGRFEIDGQAILLAVFLSPACRVCESLRPALESIEGTELISVRRFDELEDADAWAAAGVPGSPYAVAMDPAGIVLAKGTFNNLSQLEGMIGTAISRSNGAGSRAAAIDG